VVNPIETVRIAVEALVVSVLGGLCGIGLGIGAARLIDGQHLNGQTLRTLVSSASLLLALGVSLAIGLLFGVYPACSAARLHPIDALVLARRPEICQGSAPHQPGLRQPPRGTGILRSWR
jgi:hypothetical protein